MKNLFKKNQIIVTALALMIAVAGYLNFTRDQADLDEAAKLASGADYLLDTAGTMSGVGTDSTNLADAAELENQIAGGSGSLTDNLLASGTGGTTDPHMAESDMQTADGSSTQTNDGLEDTDEFADISDEYGEDAQYTVSDTGEIIVDNTQASAQASGEAIASASGEDTAQTGGDAQSGAEGGNPGEAVLASTVLDAGYFASAKLSREQTRAKNKESLMELISNVDISEEQKQEAIDKMIALTAIAEKENAAEMLLEAKGFSDVVVRILDDSVDVVVNAEAITDQQVAQSEDIVVRKTGAEASDIVITSVITGE